MLRSVLQSVLRCCGHIAVGVAVLWFALQCVLRCCGHTAVGVAVLWFVLPSLLRCCGVAVGVAVLRSVLR